MLLPHGYITGREVWFQEEKKRWIQHLTNSGSNSEEARERFDAVAQNPKVRGEVSEWIEQVGRSWDQKPNVKSKDEDGLGAYFALSIAAAGWHSGALVLVNDELVKVIADSVTDNEPLSVSDAEGNNSGMF
jgi:SCF-associated factor 1